LRPLRERENPLPNIKAAEKWSRQSEKRATRNKNVATRLKTLYKKVASSGDAATAGTVESAYDKAASKGIIHPNKAARKKSRLAKALTRATAAPVKTTKSRKKRSKTSATAAKKAAKK
jgi:small subunit ribosomal protein S20